MKITKLFEPCKIGTREIKNRIIMAPLGMPLATEKGYATDRQIAFYEARAKGGTGAIQITATSVPGSLNYVPRILNIIDDDCIPAARRLTQALQKHGARAHFVLSIQGIRLSEALNRRPPETHPERIPVWAPSAFPHPLTGWMPRELSKDDIREVVKTFGQAAKRGVLAGFDGGLLQAGHGYLLHQFLSTRTNKRTDEYGGSLEKRCRFALEIIQQIRKDAGPDFQLVVRMNGDDFLDDGIHLEDAVQHARLFEEAGADALAISTGPRETHHWQFVTMYQPSGALVRCSAAIKKVVKIPVGVAGKIDVLLAEKILQDGAADFIHWGRPLLTDPEAPNKAKAGKLDDIVPCIYCNQCRDRRWLTGDWNPCCTVNPALGKELTFKLEPAEQKKKVVVIGGGVGGMEAARTAAERGHDAHLYEKSDKLGGQWNIVEAHRPEQNAIIKFMSRQMDKAGVKVSLKTEMNAQKVMGMKPDAVIVATGARPGMPNVPGIKDKKVVQAVDVLTGKAKVGENVVIIGGHLVGMDTAVFLAGKGKKVSIVEMYKVGWGLASTLKMALMEDIIKYRVNLYQDATLQSVTPTGVYVIWDSGEMKTRGAERHELLFLRADTVVLACGSRSENSLYEQLTGMMSQVYNIGDSVEARTAFEAFHEGSEVARKI